MDILLERMLSLIPRKPDGKYVHGEKKVFCEKIGAPTNIISEWETGKTKSYRNYIHAVAMAYGVSVEWLRGETEEKAKNPPALADGLSVNGAELIKYMSSLDEKQQMAVFEFVRSLSNKEK